MINRVKDASHTRITSPRLTTVTPALQPTGLKGLYGGCTCYSDLLNTFTVAGRRLNTVVLLRFQSVYSCGLRFHLPRS